MCPVKPILFDSIVLSYLEKITNYVVPHYTFLLPLHPSQVQIFFSVAVHRRINLCYFLNVRDRDLHPYETAGNIIV
jgi:hypothetical protein